MSTAPRAKRRAAFLEPIRGEKRSTGLKPKSCESPVDARRVSPKRRWCLACDPPREKTAAAFADHASDRCRKCVRDGNPVQEPKPVSRKRLCACCGVERGLACFERHGGVRGRDPGEPFDANATSEARVGRLRGYGNAIVPQLAAVFIRAFLETEAQ